MFDVLQREKQWVSTRVRRYCWQLSTRTPRPSLTTRHASTFIRRLSPPRISFFSSRRQWQLGTSRIGSNDVLLFWRCESGSAHFFTRNLPKGELWFNLNRNNKIYSRNWEASVELADSSRSFFYKTFEIAYDEFTAPLQQCVYLSVWSSLHGLNKVCVKHTQSLRVFNSLWS